jgi:hypothetical protein
MVRNIALVCLAFGATCGHASAKPAERPVYGWECKTKLGQVVLKDMISPPFKVDEVVKATSAPYGKGVGVRNAGACSRIRFDMADGRTAMCEPIGAPTVHALIGGWQYKSIDKAQCPD